MQCGADQGDWAGRREVEWTGGQVDLTLSSLHIVNVVRLLHLNSFALPDINWDKHL